MLGRDSLISDNAAIALATTISLNQLCDPAENQKFLIFHHLGIDIMEFCHTLLLSSGPRDHHPLSTCGGAYRDIL